MKNLIAFFEIPVDDFRSSVNFYEALFDTELMIAECGEEKMACFVQEGETVGALSYAPDFRPSGDGVLIHFVCEDVEEAVRRAQALGGQLVIPTTSIQAEGKGCFAVIADPAGNHIGLYADKKVC